MLYLLREGSLIKDNDVPGPRLGRMSSLIPFLRDTLISYNSGLHLDIISHQQCHIHLSRITSCTFPNDSKTPLSPHKVTSCSVMLTKECKCNDFLMSLTWTLDIHCKYVKRLQICVPQNRVGQKICIYITFPWWVSDPSPESPVNYNHITGSQPGHWLTLSWAPVAGLAHVLMCQHTHESQFPV